GEWVQGGYQVFCFVFHQRLKAACHYTVAGLCEEVSQDKEIQFSKQTIAAISEITFRHSSKLHAKRSTINLEDVKLLARRSKSLKSCSLFLRMPSDKLTFVANGETAFLSYCSIPNVTLECLSSAFFLFPPLCHASLKCSDTCCTKEQQSL
uniref:Centromere protein S n=1 Tax=Podarcis muralis TaxID=64176 RepID=A0A670IY72_PODMU